MTKLVAITGGIGSGKSTFSKEVTKRRINLLDSDEQVANIYKKPNKSFLSFLKQIELQKSIYNKKINKKIISEIIFSNTKIRKRLEKYIFNMVRSQRKTFIKKNIKMNKKIIFFDIPLLFENKLDKQFDLVISIISTKKERYKRLKKHKKISKILFNKIIKAQTTDVVRIEKSDIVIKNNGNIDDYKKNINKILDKIIL